jgi:hypothetical protein
VENRDGGRDARERRTTVRHRITGRLARARTVGDTCAAPGPGSASPNTSATPSTPLATTAMRAHHPHARRCQAGPAGPSSTSGVLVAGAMSPCSRASHDRNSAHATSPSATITTSVAYSPPDNASDGRRVFARGLTATAAAAARPGSAPRLRPVARPV